MVRFLFSPQEASFLVALKSDTDFSLPQAMIWSNLSATEARHVLDALISKELIVPVAIDLFAFTEGGIKAKHQLRRADDAKFLISEADLDATKVNDALGDIIKKLK